MATCRICGNKDKSLPETWTDWECWRCFLDCYTCCSQPVSSKATEIVMADIKRRRDTLNMMLVDAELHQALENAEID